MVFGWLPYPLQVGFGEGRIAIHEFHSKSGMGLLLVDTDQVNPIGKVADQFEDASNHTPQAGEIYLHFKNEKSLDVFLECLLKVKERFEEARLHDQ